MDIKYRKILIVGTGGSGKTIYARDLWATFKLPMAYDINGDYEKLKGGVAYSPQYAGDEVMSFVDFALETKKKKKVDALFFDDADAYMDYELMHNSRFKDMVIRHRNPAYELNLVFVAKRPQNLPTKIVENCHDMIIYQMEGVNAIQRLKEVDERIIPLLEKLKPYEYIYKEEGKEPVIKPPVPLK